MNGPSLGISAFLLVVEVELGVLVARADSRCLFAFPRGAKDGLEQRDLSVTWRQNKGEKAETHLNFLRVGLVDRNPRALARGVHAVLVLVGRSLW